MRLDLEAAVAIALLAAPFARGAHAQPDEVDRAEARPRRSVQITESSAVVFALECPHGSQPTWQPVSFYSMLGIPELELFGVGRTSVCGVDVRGRETQVILACQRPDGTHHGPIGSWHPGGEKRTVGRCENGLAHGVWRRYRRDGRLDLEGRFKRGELAGTWTEWAPSGEKRTLAPAELRSSPPVF